MKKLLKLGRSLSLWACTCVGAGIITLQAATLQWNTNPEPDIAFYTVYAESASGTVARQAAGTQLLLDGWLTNGSYTFYVTATSSAGLESDRSLGMPYVFGTIAAPVITTQPAGKLLASGSTLTMSVTATSASAATYQWRKDGLALTGQTAAIFSKSNITVSDSGAYTVVVSNGGGSVTSSPAQVVVQVPPSISTHPLSSSVAAGSAVTLSVGASGTALRYQWFKDGGALAGRTNSSFSIASMTAADQGIYRAVVTNLVGSASSANATLGIVYPPTIVAGPAGTNIAAGGTIQLSVVASGTAPFTYQWIKDSQPIANATGSQWVMTGASSSHSGSYQVRVSNAAGSVMSQVATVQVFPRISIVQQPTGTNVPLGGELNLAVQATGPSGLKYQWYRENVALNGATNAQLQIAQVSSDHAGSYTVDISSALERVSSLAALVTVSGGAPAILSQPTGGEYLEGTNLTLTVKASSPSPMTYQWFLNNSAISGATDSKYQKSPAQTADSGSYTVRVANSNGAVNSDPASVLVLQPIVIVLSPTGTNVAKGGRITLWVEATGPAGMTYQWYLNGSKLNGKTSSSLTVSSASLADGGIYTCQITSPVQTLTTVGAEVIVIDPLSASDCILTLSVAGDGSLVITGVAPINTNYELQRSDSLTAPNWTRIQNVSSRAEGRFQVIVPMGDVGTGFIRTVRRAN